MDPVVLTAGTALIAAMTTDAWQQARTAAVDWWRRMRPAQVDQAQTDLDVDRTRVLVARQEADQDTEEAVVGAWRLRLHDLVGSDPAMIKSLRELLENHLQPSLPTQEQSRIEAVVMRAEARGQARVYMAARDQHITGQ
jgi:hypothetical protein